MDHEEPASASRVAVEAAISELRSLIVDYDPIELLARVTTYIVPSDPDKPKDSGGPSKSETNLDYLMSLITAHQFPREAKFPDPDVIQRSINLLTTIHLAATNYLLMLPRRNTASEEAIGDFADAFRLEKLHVRGEAYWPHLKTTILDLLKSHDPKLREVLGFTSVDYFRFMERTESEVQNRLDAQVETHVRPYADRMRPWFHVNKGGDSEPTNQAAFARFLAENETELVAARARFDLFGGPEVFVFCPRSDAEERILAALSCECGENTAFHGKKPEHAFWPLTDSLTDHRPIIQKAGTYYAFNLPKLSREAYTLIGDLLRTLAPDYWRDVFLKARDAYLEMEAARLLQHALPNAQVLRSVDYPLTVGGFAESDIIVLCDDLLMVVECKAGRLDQATKRGADKKIVSDLRATVAGGLNQAERFVQELVARGTMQIRVGKTGETVTIDAKRFRYVLRVNVTLDLIIPASTQLWKLYEAGLTEGIERCWSVSLNDLRVIIDILDQPAAFVHYLLRRLDLNILRTVRAKDELDYLMHYVRQGLFFRESNAPKQNEQVMVSGFTEELDQYYRRVQGVSERGEKPRINFGERTERIIAMLQKTRPVHWISGCLELLEFDTLVREELLAKLVNHGHVVRDPRAAYALSFVANAAGRRGLALVSSLKPAQISDVVHGRAVQLCRKHGLDEILVLIGSFPDWGSEVYVVLATGTATVSSGAARLLNQLLVKTTEMRRTDSGSR